MEINFNPSIAKNLPVDIYLKHQMDSLGLQPTGSKETDLKAIQNALSKKDLLDTEKVCGQCEKMPPPRTPEAIATFMSKLGLQPTNSKEGDNAAITAKLSELESNAKTDAEKQNVQSLKSEFETLIAQAGDVGQQLTGIMNKSFFNLKS